MFFSYCKRPVALGVLLCAGLLPAGTATAAAWHPGTSRSAFVTLFEWDWPSIGRECTQVLGPKGYAAVQVSPPQEHPVGDAWWWRYQPVSYALTSRSGSREQFAAMVRTCRAAGVEVYVDAVLNHMANYNGGRATAGSSWGSRDFPGVPWQVTDFHQPKCDIRQSDYDQEEQRNRVTECDIPGLPDLDTGSARVQRRLGDYLQDLYQLGVRGFRIDAAKHIRPAELAAIRARLPDSVFFTQEVMRDAGVIRSGDFTAYQQLGQVNEFNYVYAMRNAFANREGFNPARLPQMFETWGFMPSDKATVFVHNHDTERDNCSVYAPGGLCNSLSTYNGDTLFLAHAFMLAWPYGYPSVGSGYYFRARDEGPPRGRPRPDAQSDNCSAVYAPGKWDCVHRDRRVANLVGLRNYAGAAPLAHWQQGNAQQIAFARAGRAFVAINNSDVNWQQTFETGLADGRYCNVVAAEHPERGECNGAELVVSQGRLTASITPHAVVAIHVGARPRQEPCDRPAPFSFPEVSDAPAGSLVYSATITVSGLRCPSPIRIAGGRYSLDGQPFTTQPGSVRNGQRLRVEVRTPERINPAQPVVEAVVTIGGQSARFRVSLRPPVACNNPADFAFPPVHNAPPGRWVSSAPVQMRGLSCPARVTIEGGRYSIDNGPFTRQPGQIRNGQTLRVQLQTPPGRAEAGAPEAPRSPLVAIVRVGTDERRFVVELDEPPPHSVCPAGQTVCTQPAQPRAGEAVTLLYQGTLNSSRRLQLHWGINGWLGITDSPMQRVNGGWSVRITLPATARQLDFAFSDGQRWDNHGGRDWHLPVQACRQCGEPVSVQLQVHAPTLWGESVYLTGAGSLLGQWSTQADPARRCTPERYPVWTCRLSVPAGTVLEYKYIKIGRGHFWEQGYNRQREVPVGGGTLHDGAFRP